VLEFPELTRVKCNKKFIKKKSDWSVFWALWKVQNKAIPTVPPEGKTEEWKALNPRVKAANVPNWAQQNQESI
jgi:hypothetical protein